MSSVGFRAHLRCRLKISDVRLDIYPVECMAVKYETNVLFLQHLLESLTLLSTYSFSLHITRAPGTNANDLQGWPGNQTLKTIGHAAIAADKVTKQIEPVKTVGKL